MGSRPARRPAGVTPLPPPSARDRRSDAPPGGRRHSDLVWTTLIAALPHELRRSLGVISLLSDALDASTEAGAQIALEVRRIDRLIDALTEVSRAVGGQGVALEPLTPSRVLAAAVAAFARDPDRCEVAVEREDDLPPVRGNAILTEVVLLNLLSNASRYGKPPVVLSARRGGTVVAFAVSDAGGGVSRGRAALAVPSTSGTAPGAMGAGLAISHLFASEMGGWLDVWTGAGGSRVSLCLPVATRR